MSKRKSQLKHSLQRASLRAGADLKQHEYNKLLTDIQDGNAEFVERQSNRVTKFKVELEGKEFIAVYDKHRKVIVTFLYPEGDKLAKDLEELYPSN